MIKMISFNNFDNFDGKTNAFNDAETDATAQNFTAILSGFSTTTPKPENILPNAETIAKTDVSDKQSAEPFQISSETETKIKAMTDSPLQKTNQDIFIQKSDPQIEETGVNKNKMMPDLYQPEDPTIKQNGEIIKGKIQVNYLNKVKTDKEMVADAPERLPVLPKGIEKIEPPANQETFAEYPPEGRILTQFDNADSKKPSMWSRDQSIPRETPNKIPNVQIPNFANQERRESSVRFVTKQDNILDLPPNDFPPMNAAVKENPILTIENGKRETVEILSVESSSTKPVNNNFLVENKPISVEKVLTEENKTPVLPKIEISEKVSELKNSSKNLNSAEKVLSGLNPLNVASYENNKVKPAAGQTDILEFPEIQTPDSKEIVEIKTDNFQLLDFTQGETSEIKQIPSEQDFAANEFEIKTLDEKTQPQLDQSVKTEVPQTVESKINADSVQFKNLKYFFNFETNRVDEVKPSDLPADSNVLSETETADLKKDFAVESQPTNNLTKLYDKVSEIVREDGVDEKNRAEIKSAEVKTEINISEIKAKNPAANQSEELWAGYTNDNPVQTTNSIRREIKPREVFGKEVFDEFGISAANENRSSQDFAKPQILNFAINPAQERVDFNTQNVNLQNPQTTIAQINLTQAERPIPKPDKPLEMSMKISDLNFEKFLNPMINKAEIIKDTPNSLIEDGTVFEQIEPKIIELAEFVDKTGETDILKMRLNPAELGEIEIRLEKDASGKMNAHIQTKTEATQHILGESLGQLRESLQNAGWQVEKLEVSYNANQSNGNEHRENRSRELETEETGRKNAFGFDGNLENEGEKTENPSDRLVNLRA